MSTLRHLVLAMIVVLLTAVAARADITGEPEPAITLKVGDPAPPLKVAAWVKGTPVAKIEKGQIYVVEFWATWCGPCRQTIPHVSDLQKQHKDVVFIGMDCWEDDPAGVEKFVKSMGEKMNYRVGLDDGERGTMAGTWLTAAGRSSIPTAFIVNKESKIVWIGHPAAMDAALKAIVAGNFDPAREAMAAEFMGRLQRAIRTDKVAPVEAICDEFIKAMPEKADVVTRLRFAIALRKKDYAAANQQAVMFAVASKDDAEGLNDVAWALINPKNPIPGADLDLALKMSLRAVELTKNENAPILDTAARACFLKGDLTKAVELQTTALAKADDANAKTELKATLDKYTAAKAGK